MLERHIDTKMIAEPEAERLRLGIIDDTLPARACELLGLLAVGGADDAPRTSRWHPPVVPLLLASAKLTA